jgi:hypothetical protein
LRKRQRPANSKQPGPAKIVLELEPAASPGSPAVTTISLNSIELALIAELNLEMALAQDAVAQDAIQRLETREIASEAAARWRGRARWLQLQAQRQSADSIVPDEPMIHAPAAAYSGPERRRQMRRQRARRTETPVGSAPGRGDQRISYDRRKRERRRAEVVLP